MKYHENRPSEQETKKEKNVKLSTRRGERHFLDFVDSFQRSTRTFADVPAEIELNGRGSRSCSSGWIQAYEYTFFKLENIHAQK